MGEGIMKKNLKYIWFFNAIIAGAVSAFNLSMGNYATACWAAIACYDSSFLAILFDKYGD
jgi:hypothetical protein